MSETEKNENTTITEETVYEGEGGGLHSAYMNRRFCSPKERVVYIVKSAVGGMNLGRYDTNSEFFLYKIFGLSPTAYAKASATLGIYDILNDPLSAIIIDNMRTRWGKFKPFLYLSIIPSVILGLLTCFMPAISRTAGLDATQKLIFYMVIAYASETVGAFFGGGGYIDNVFTPNPNERTELLVSARLVSSFFTKVPGYIMGLTLDLLNKGIIKVDLLNTFVVQKTLWWVIATVPAIMWALVSRERVPQSRKRPNPVKGFLSVFRNKPLLICTLSELVGGIDIGTNETLYYDEVLHFNMMTTVAGIPGMPVSYLSYPLATKLRKRFSTKALSIMESSSIVFSESLFFIVGCIGGERHGLYDKVVPMTIAFGVGNIVEMLFYGTKQIIGKEIEYEVLDYCEWKNGYRVEATISLIKGYFNKVKDILLKIVNAYLLEKWAGFQAGINVEQTQSTKWRMFLTACGPHLIFDVLGIIPMLFYNIDKKTREKMYLELELARSRASNAATHSAENAGEQTGSENAE